MKLKVFRVRPGSKLPKRAYQYDAGMDLFYCPDPSKTTGFFNEQGQCLIPPKTSCLIPTGICMEVPRGFMFEIKNKSGIASKRRLVVGSCVVDSSYAAEISVNLHNIGTETQIFEPGEKIAQGVLIAVELCDIVEVESNDDINQDSDRGLLGFGSSGRF